MRKGEFFATRAILNTDEESVYLNDDRNRAKLSVIADSTSVEIYALDRKQLTYIPDYVQVWSFS